MENTESNFQSENASRHGGHSKSKESGDVGVGPNAGGEENGFAIDLAHCLISSMRASINYAK